ncbi:MAG: DUF2147 domain-containing protein [Daejeonella sp.]
MKKNIYCLVVLLLLAFTAFSQNKDAVLGKWLNKSGECHLQIYKKGVQYFGKLTWLKEPNDAAGKPKLDNKNPVEALRKNPLQGLEILKGFNYAGDGVWEKGSIYDPKTGKTYNCKMSMESSDKLDMRGYVGISLLGRTETWTRVK